MYKSFFILFALLNFSIANAQDDSSTKDTIIEDASFADYQAFLDLTKEVQKHRAARMISLDEMKKMSSEPNTIILDTRSKAMYDAKHIKGAIHLNFADFTSTTLATLIPNPETRVLIYCNNNFINDQIYFPTKGVSSADDVLDMSPIGQSFKITMALNIPTYINLYGYGYKNVYELKDLVSVFSTEIEFEGSEVASN